MDSFLATELSYVDRDLTYAKERHFNFEHGGHVSILQDISHVGGTIWDASVVLSHYLDSLGPATLSGKSMVEIGAGTALPSIVGARLGMDVVATDMQDVLHHTDAAIHRNCDKTCIRSQELVWGSRGVGLDALLSSTDSAVPCKGYDYIVGADIVYNDAHFMELQETLLALSGMGTASVVLVCFEQRRRDLTAFWESFKPHFDMARLSTPMLDKCREDVNVFMYKLTRKPHATLADESTTTK
ncbi:Aste57867_13708 [Aphanomyces stellatus]|uniref:Aste57867_13708 protein n=1 Tax=Aphanomyces stellatus TaxID=120398 RepID=A0A485KZD0_9STRA|nr:hypothetical protein As57867_013658 [Aphanomyces stellatus]VFT90541.1 Aste57867_13708 [Aphanomyces stellatus]